MHTGQRAAEFPIIAGHVDSIYRRRNGTSDKQSAVSAFYDEAAALRQAIGEPPPKAALRNRTRAARARALARRPLTMQEVLFAADAMGIDAFINPELVFLAEIACTLELPLGWERVELPEANAGFYKNGLLRLSQWQHPHLTYLIALGKMYTAADAADAK